ncbi:hypothetical protein PV327_008828 [Microctonus hyperodae]|uniref:Uncharacterized protein n=1 Tax=Microctonus hyperodae TaxID=165561 RepID=A0AA39KV38_MICHY|nr:hypothetical protein PV327_008828 [Microctonus hyperodae]
MSCEKNTTLPLEELRGINCQVGPILSDGITKQDSIGSNADNSPGAKPKRKSRSTRRRLNAMMSNVSLHFSDTDSEGELTKIRNLSPAKSKITQNINNNQPQLQAPIISVTLENSDSEQTHFNWDGLSDFPTPERRNSFAENLTDVDEIYGSDTDNDKVEKKGLDVMENNLQGETDIEDMSNDEGDDDIDATPIYIKPRFDILREFGGGTITTKEGDGPFSVEIRNQMSFDESDDVHESRHGLGAIDNQLHGGTDSEDIDVSDEDEEPEGAYGQRNILEDFDLLAASQVVVKNVNKMENLLSVPDIADDISDNAATIHESLAQKVACPIQSVDASYPNNISNDGEISPNREKKTYSEKRKFWEDITKKRENYQRSESEVSRTSQLTINESDSDYLQNVVSEEDLDTMPERSETMEDLNIPDMSECSVAEKAHYFEEQIQKELATKSRPVSKLISQDSLIERRTSITEEQIDTKDAKHDRNVLEFERGEKSDVTKINIVEQLESIGNLPELIKEEKQICSEFILNEIQFTGDELQQTVDKMTVEVNKKPEALEVSEPKPSLIPRKILPEIISKFETEEKVKDAQLETTTQKYIEDKEFLTSEINFSNDEMQSTTEQSDKSVINKNLDMKKDNDPETSIIITETKVTSKIPMKIKTEITNQFEIKHDVTETKGDIPLFKRETSNLSEKDFNKRESKIPVPSGKVDKEKLPKLKDNVIESLSKDTEIIPDDKKKRSGIPKRVIETSITKIIDKDPTEEEIAETTKTKITEKVSQHYQEHTSETKTQSQTFTKTFTDAKEAMKAFEDMETLMASEISVTMSKVDHVKSTKLEKKEIISSEISRGDEKTLMHKENERKLCEKSIESIVTRETLDETTEDKISKVKKSDKIMTQEIAVNSSGGKQIIDASASEAMTMINDEQHVQSLEDSDGIVIQEAGMKKLKEHEIEMAVKIEKDELQSREEKEIDVSELRMSLDDELKAAVIREEIHQESSSHSDTKMFPSRETSEDISRDEAFVEEIFEDNSSHNVDKSEARNIAETIVQSIEDEIVKRSESSGALKLGFDFENEHMDVESETFDEELADDLTKKFENIMGKRKESQAQVIESIEQVRASILGHDERLDKDSTRGSLSVSDDLTKDEDSTPHDREESFASSSSQAKIIDRDFTMSPSSMSDQIELEEAFEMEKQSNDNDQIKQIIELPIEIKVAEEYIEEPGEVALKFEACESSGARVLEILEPVQDYEMRQDLIDASSLENDEPRKFYDRNFSSDDQYMKDLNFTKLHESPAVHSLDKICDTDMTFSPSTPSESSLVHGQSQSFTKVSDIIKNDDWIESDDAGFSSMEHERPDAETITNLNTNEIDINIIPPVVSPRTKLKELEIDHSKWMIGEEKIVVTEILQPSQEFDKELDEYHSSIVKQQSFTSSHDGSGELESVTRSSEDISTVDSVRESSAVEITVAKPRKFTVELVNEIDVEQEVSLIEDKLDVSCQELVDTLKREYEAKTPTDEQIPLTPRRTSESEGESIVEEFVSKQSEIPEYIPTDESIVELNEKISVDVPIIDTKSIKSNEKIEMYEAEEKDVDTQEVLEAVEKKEMKVEVALKGLKETFPNKSLDNSKKHLEKSSDTRDKSVQGLSIDSGSLKLKKDDLSNVELSARYAITVLDQVVKKEIAEVKESLEAAKQDLIEELSENSETVFQIKDSPSEFQFKLQPESIPNDLPFLYKAPSLEQVVTDRDVHSESSTVKPRNQEYENMSETADNNKNITDESVAGEIKVAVHKVIDECSSVPIPASRSSSDVETKEGSSSLSLPPQPAPRKRQKPARVSKKIYSESEGGSSSGESSNYQSCDYEIGSGSRPSSSDIEALQSASGVLSGTASEYETALMSIEQSSISKRTSQEYHSAVSTLSSRESMKSLNSLSSGHLGSIDSTGELTETLVASESEEEIDKEEINENLELALDDEDDQGKVSEDSLGSDIPLDESFDNVSGDIPNKMKRSSEMIFQQISDDAESSLDPEMLEGSNEDQSTKITSSVMISEDDDVKTSLIDATTEQLSGKIESSSSAENKLKFIEPQSTGDDIDSSELKMGSASMLDEAETLLLSKRSVLQQASMSTSSTSGMSTETVIEREKIERHSPDSDSFELVDKPDIIDDFVVIEEVGREAEEFDAEGKSISIKTIPHTVAKKFDRDLENSITDTKEDTQISASQVIRNNELFDFDPEESPPQASNEDQYSQSYSDDEQDAKKWMEMQFQADSRAFDLEYDRGPLEDIKEEEITDFEAGSSRFGSLGSHKGSIGSSGSMKGSYGSAVEYDIIAGRKILSKSIEHDNISMNSLQEFESLENVVASENARRLQQCGSQDSINNGSLPRRYMTSRSGHGDDISVSSLKDFEGLESACKEAHIIELRAKEEEDLLEHESPENRYRLENLPKPKLTESSVAGSFNPSTSGSDDYEKRIMEIDEIIRIAQANVEKFDRQDDTTEDISQIEITDLEKNEPIIVTSALPETEDVSRTRETTNIMETSTDSLELEENAEKKYNPMFRSSDSLEMKTTIDFPSLSYSDSLNNVRESQDTQIIDPFNSVRRISSDSLEMPVLDQPSHIEDNHGVDIGIYQPKNDEISVDVKITKNGKTTFSKATPDM